MAWYEGTFACGHEGRVNIIGPQKDRGYSRRPSAAVATGLVL